MQPAHSDHTTNSAFYDRISKAYDLIADASEHTYRQHGISALNLQPGSKVMEIGFGTGNGLIELLESMGGEGKVTGLDISKGMRDVALGKIEAKEMTKSIDLVIGSALELPFPDNSFDAVFMSFTLELFENDEIPAVLGGIKQVLKPRGALGVVALSLPPLGQEEASIMTKSYQWFHRHFPHIADCKPIEVTKFIKDSGLKIVSDEREGMWGMDVAVTVAAKPI
jgi:ubiquinone/menaquinone biosynthesis C-methylase UbiE